MLRQFVAKDPQSTAFRFPDGSPPPERGHIDILNFSDVAERAYALIDASVSGISEAIQQRAEMELDYQDWLGWHTESDEPDDHYR